MRALWQESWHSRFSWGVPGITSWPNCRRSTALLNASMILAGMGPVDPVKSTAAKLFATFYALYSGIAFLTMIAILMAPLLHRFLHQFHLEEQDGRKAGK